MEKIKAFFRKIKNAILIVIEVNFTRYRYVPRKYKWIKIISMILIGFIIFYVIAAIIMVLFVFASVSMFNTNLKEHNDNMEKRNQRNYYRRY